jgi:Methyltransferase FkbM domain
MRRIIYVLRSIWQEDSNRGQRLRRVLFFFGWQLWKRTVGTPLNARLLNGFRIRVWRDCDSSPAAFYYLYPIDAVKIDVEGHENSVLRGMKEFLKHHRPKLVMFEYLRFRDSANRN